MDVFILGYKTFVSCVLIFGKNDVSQLFCVLYIYIISNEFSIIYQNWLKEGCMGDYWDAYKPHHMQEPIQTGVPQRYMHMEKISTVTREHESIDSAQTPPENGKSTLKKKIPMVFPRFTMGISSF